MKVIYFLIYLNDLEFFKTTTMNKVVIMGRSTLLSLPKEQPLKNRINIALSTNLSFKGEGCIVCHSLDELFEELKNIINEIEKRRKKGWAYKAMDIQTIPKGRISKVTHWKESCSCT